MTTQSTWHSRLVDAWRDTNALSAPYTLIAMLLVIIAIEISAIVADISIGSIGFWFYAHVLALILMVEMSAQALVARWRYRHSAREVRQLSRAITGRLMNDYGVAMTTDSHALVVEMLYRIRGFKSRFVVFVMNTDQFAVEDTDGLFATQLYLVDTGTVQVVRVAEYHERDPRTDSLVKQTMPPLDLNTRDRFEHPELYYASPDELFELTQLVRRAQIRATSSDDQP